MPRKSSVTFNLSTKTGRSKLPFGPKPYNQQLPADGLLIGYCKNPSGGVWFVRKRRLGTSQYDSHKIGFADDTKDCDGVTVFSYEQACAAAEKWYRAESGLVAASDKAYTVADLVAEYRLERRTKKLKKENSTLKSQFETDILPAFGEVPVRQLKEQHMREWFDKLAAQAPRTRWGKLKKVEDPEDEDYLRGRQVTANRIYCALQAVLNWGYKRGRVPSKAAWEKIEVFQHVSEPKIVPIAREDLMQVIRECEPGFQPLARSAVYTGARYGELSRMRVRDFNYKTRKVFLPKTKNGDKRHVFLHSEALEMFVELTRGKKENDHIFVRPTDGKPWNKGDQKVRMRRAVEAAGVTPEFTFHQLRHQCAVISLEDGMTMAEVSHMLGHKSVAVTEKYYAHHSVDHMQDKVEKCAPRLGFGSAPRTPDQSKVIVLPVAV
jgi:integrase